MTVVSNDVYDAIESEFSLFGLYGVNPDNTCECGNPECQALYKHPRLAKWQAVPNQWSQEQLDVMIEIGHFATGYGILTRGLMVIDVDARNGGVDSFKRLCDDLEIDLYDECAYVVNTGSGGGSMHLYFKSPMPPKALMQHHDKYKGIDFKCNSGFVVGAGSLHKSGNRYEVDKGYPQDLTEMPQALIDLLEKKTQYRSTDLNGETVDIEVDELQNIVSHIPKCDQYQRWVDVGMAIHDTTQGSMQGLAIWDAWSQQADNYESGVTATKWASFGKGASLVSLGTLMHYAKENGYVQPVTFNADVYIKDEPTAPTTLDDMIAHVDIRKPPKFAGLLCDWINAQCRYPRENLAAAASLYILSCVGGMRHYDDQDNMSLNFMPFGIAGSSSGKEAIFQAITECLSASGLMAAVHGNFKSEQEAVRNLLRHQASFYLIDELGIELQKITQASKKGGAAYLAGLIGFFMKVYSKADGIMPISGDLKEDIKDKIKSEISKANKKADEVGEDKVEAELNRLYVQLNQADNGIVNPYFNMFGLTTPVTFDSIVDFEMATNGFIARACIFREHETNPRRKKNFKSKPMDMHLQLALNQLYTGGHTPEYRVERVGEKTPIYTTDEAQDLLEQIDEYFYEMAESHKTKTGLEAICRRGWEICSKISLITGMPSGTRTIEDVMYGFAVAKWDIQKKLELAYGNEAAQHNDTKADALKVKIIGLLDKDNTTTVGQIRNRLREFKKEDIDKMLGILVDSGTVVAVETTHKVNKTITVKYKLG